mmetsp:Transcript_20392/g.45978  ORF Transcript_20392/g.45978 Transcript_20392/m.45978 type:complete len:246 (-) Transcript_20392:1006-1743(-)
MSSEVRRCKAWLLPPTVTSNTDCFFCCNSTIFSSMVSVATKRVACTGRVCPIRWARWMAWSSEAGFHQGSMRKMWSAACKFKPSPPAFNEMRSTFSEGSVIKATMMLFREAIGMVPRSFAQLTPSRFSLHSMSSKKRVNWEKTRALLEESAAVIRRISSRSASILVEVLNSEALIRCMMPLFNEAAPPLLPATADASDGGGCSGSSSSPAASSRPKVSGLKQVGQPMPPQASLGACSRYSDKHSR